MKKIFLTLSLCTFFSLFSFNSIKANDEIINVKVKKTDVSLEQKESALITWPAMGGIVVGDPFPFVTFVTWF